MATHNQVREVGYLLKDPKIINEGKEGSEKILFQIRTVRRNVDNYHGKKFEDVIIYYDGTEFMEKLKKLKRFDLIDVKGVFNVLTVNKKSLCPFCGTQNVKYRGSSTFIYPIAINKLNSVLTSYEQDADLPEAILEKHYTEISNQALIIGTIVSDPEMIGTEKRPCCRYRLGVDRKYYIKTQDDITADYPWVYSYGQQAEWDYRHLQQGSVILVDGFIHNRQVNAKIQCEHCGSEYTYPDVTTEFIPYSLEYLSNYRTDEDIAMEEEMAKREAIHNALNG
jgi:hypothetical protein